MPENEGMTARGWQIPARPLAISLAIRAAERGRRVYYGSLRDLIQCLQEAERKGAVVAPPPDGCVLETDLIVYDLLASGSTDILMDFDIDLATELLGSLADVCGFCEVWESGTVIYDVTAESVSLGGGWEIRLPQGWAAVHKPGQYRSTDRDDPVRNFRITGLDWIQVRD